MNDAAMIDEVIEAVEEGGRLPPLSHAELNLGRFSVAKVLLLIRVYSSTESVLIAQESRYENCQQPHD